MLKKILIALVVVVVAVIALISLQPDSFRIERSAQLAAKPDAVFHVLVDFHRWQEWSPWDKLDPALKREFSGPEAGVGASYGWEGNDDVGAGRMTIVVAKEFSEIRIKLEFLKPFAATNTTIFSLTPAQDGTKLTWAMEGESGFMSKAISLFMDMDEMVGKDFEKGLSNLATVLSLSPQ